MVNSIVTYVTTFLVSMDGRKYRELQLGGPGNAVRIPGVSFPFLRPPSPHLNVDPASTPPPPISMLIRPCVSLAGGMEN